MQSLDLQALKDPESKMNNNKSLAASINGKPVVIYCDFDGTVTTTDVTDTLLEKLADPQWQEIEESWVKGEIDDCQCMAEQIALIRGDWKKITHIMDSIEIDPHFQSFTSFCSEHNIPIYIGSNGLDKVIEYILDRKNISVSGSWAYYLQNNNGNWSLKFPQGEERGSCKVPASIACKCALLEKKLTQTTPYKIVVGDSKSDFCWAHKADLVLAKPKLAKYCSEQNITHEPFSDFEQITNTLKQKLSLQAL